MSLIYQCDFLIPKRDKDLIKDFNYLKAFSLEHEKPAYFINRIKGPRCCPIIPLFFHIILYLHKKHQVNYLTRGVKKTFQIVAVEENV